MKKGLIVILGLMLVGVLSISSGQGVIYEEDFEASDGGYTHSGTNDEWEWGHPTSGPGNAHSGNNCWATDLDGNYENQNYGYNYLYSVGISIPSGVAAARLSFWHWMYKEYYWDRCGLYISPDNSSWTRIDWWQYTYGNRSWEQYTYRLPDSYIGGTLYIRWGLQTDYSVTYPGWYIDDVTVESPYPTPEIDVAKILSPPGELLAGETYTPQAEIRNNGYGSAPNVPVACSIWTKADNVLRYHDERTVNVPDWASTTVSFNDWTVPSAGAYCGQAYRVKISVDYQDDNLDNNSKEIDCVVKSILLAEYYFDQEPEFTHTTYRCNNDIWEWGAPASGGSYGGYPGTPPSSPYCWGTKIHTYYPSYAGARLLSPVITLPPNSKRVDLLFKHWWYVYWRYAGGNVKLSLDGGDFNRIEPVGGYPSSVYYGCLSGERAYTYYGPRRWVDARFKIDLPPGTEEVQFAWDFGSYYVWSWYYYRRYGWAIDNVKVYVSAPPIAITDIGGIPALAGINCCYTPMITVKNMSGKDLGNIDVLRRITQSGDTTPVYESSGQISSLSKDAEEEVSLENWCAPSTPNVIFYDTAFAGFGGVYLDTVARVFEVRVDVGEHEPKEPMDTIYTDMGYYPMVTLKALIGCDVPTHASLTLQDSTAHAVYYSEQDIILEGSKDVTFDSLKVDDPGYYTFVLVTETEGDSIFENDTLKWDVRALTRGALDVGTEAILMPSKANPGDSIAPKAIVKNYGTVRATNFDVECTIDPDGYKDTKTITGIDPGEVDTVEFMVWVPAEPVEHTVTVTTKLVGDEHPENDSKTYKVTGIAEQALPTKFDLSTVRPNPMNSQTVISYQLPVRSKVSLGIYDITGKLVKNLVTHYSSPGYYTVTWDGRDASGRTVSAGIYFVKFTTPEYKATRKVVLTR